MTNYVQYKDPTDTAGFPSSIIWADCPMVELMHDPGKGFHHFDDFRGYTETATGVGNSSGHPVFEGATTMTRWLLEPREVLLPFLPLTTTRKLHFRLVVPGL